jgi:dinuclear metal center YbgI/SA1388 family protein
MVVAHHGLIWNTPRRLTGAHGRHVRFLLDQGISLYAAHLPLDLHPTLGNNAGLARLLGLVRRKPFGRYHDRVIGFQGVLPRPRTIRDLAAGLDRALGGRSVLLPFGRRMIRSVGVVSGGAAEELAEAIEKDLDCYITGEPIHACHHLALEAGINVIFAGHYHTEKPGVQAVGRWLARRFGLETVFLDLPTVV